MCNLFQTIFILKKRLCQFLLTIFFWSPLNPPCERWTNYTLLGVLHAIAPARIVILNAVNRPDDASEKSTLLLRCENDRLRSKIALLQRELEIKNARFSRRAPRKRPAYIQNERFEIFVNRSARGWNNEVSPTFIFPVISFLQDLTFIYYLVRIVFCGIFYHRIV